MLNKIWFRVVRFDGGWRVEAYDPRSIKDQAAPHEAEPEIFEARLHLHRFDERKAAFRFRDRVQEALETGRDLDFRYWEAA